ncbi:hypothetical protein RJ639_014686 [Escallonia herrerae]|uniref:Protein IQ-DOMAIN 1 n=1 Tax=Escallonia herrerae TaxID=1293975 RepID=A0AA88VIF2_9ASTE|nr:hypothetical protein RJ639_014686 [Escallonia herrerae]
MGITGELVRSVFSKSRSIGAYDSSVRSNSVERRRWSSVRSYLCGDEFNSVLAEEDSASFRSSKATISQPEFSSVFEEEDSISVRSSEATVTQPIIEELLDRGDVPIKGKKEETQEEKQNCTSQLFRKDDAASVIQSAFRNFLARRQIGVKLMDGKQELVEGGTPCGESVGTSVEVQTGNSTDVFSFQEESTGVPHRMQQKVRAQVLKLKEDWDDSTVSSNMSKMRIQNRLEATTRRERALAYAFSQQLRICSKKKQTKSEGTDPNMDWNWLERWMATRQQESSLMDVTKQMETITSNQRSVVRKKLFDLAGEEKESCGSNEVSTHIDCISVATGKEKDEFRPGQNRLKAPSMSRRKTVPGYQYRKEHTKVSGKHCPGEDERDKKNKPRQPAGSSGEISYEDASSDVSPYVMSSDPQELLIGA